MTKAAPTPAAAGRAASDAEALVHSGQRKINLIWEVTQAAIAVSVTGLVGATQLREINSPVIYNAWFLIVGFYFSRTNHTQIGGVGSKPKPPYEGR